MTTQQNAQVAAHAEPVSAIRWVDAPTGGVLASGSWDKTLKVRWLNLHPAAVYQSLIFICGASQLVLGSERFCSDS